MGGARHDDPVASLNLLGGRPSLDFVNTVDPRVGPKARDFLRSYDDLARWAAYAGIVGAADAARLRRGARRRAREARTLFARSIALREALFRIFTHAERPADLRIVQRELAAAYAGSRLPAHG